MIKKFIAPVICLFMLLMASCSFFNTTPAPIVPETTKEAYITAEAQFTGFVQTATKLRNQGLMTDEQYADLDEFFNDVEEYLDVANFALAQGNLEKADNNIEKTNQVLYKIRKILVEVEE